MRHRKRGRKLGRNPAHRKAMLRNMANSLFLHGRIVTTVAKAKELRPFAERLITLARRGTVHARRLVIARLGKQPIPPDHPDHGRYRNIVHKLFAEIAPRYIDRPGGYTRIIKIAKRRLGDAGELAMIALVEESIAESRERNANRRGRRRAAEAEAEVEAPEPQGEQTEEGAETAAVQAESREKPAATESPSEAAEEGEKEKKG